MNSKQFLKEGFLEDAHEAHVDHEVQMARVDCYYAAEHAIVLHKLLRNISEEQGLEGWVASKITLANDYLKSVREHLEYQMMNADADEDDFLPLAEGLSQTKKKVSEDITDRDDSIEEFERGPWYVILRGQPVLEDGTPKRFNWLNGAKTYFRSMMDDDPELAREIKREYDEASDKKAVIYYTKKLPATQTPTQQQTTQQEPPAQPVSEAGNKPGLWANIRAKRERIKAGSGERMRKPGSKGAPSNADLKSIRAASNESTELEESLADEFGDFVKKFGQQRGITIKPHDPKPRSPFSEPENKRIEKPLDRESLEARLKELQSIFDPAYEYSDDHAFWSDQNEIAKEIRSIERALVQQGVAEGSDKNLNEMNPYLVQQGLEVVIDFLSKYPTATAVTAGAAGAIAGGAIIKKLVTKAWQNHKELEQLKQDILSWSYQKLHANKNVGRMGGKVAKIIQKEIERRKQNLPEQGVAEGSIFAGKQEKIRELKNLIAIAKEKGNMYRVQELELELKKLRDGVYDSEWEDKYIRVGGKWQPFMKRESVAEGSSPKEKQKTPYRDINSPEYRAAAEKQKQKMTKDKAAEPGKKLADKIAKKGVAEGSGAPEITPGMKTQYGTVVSVNGNTVTVKTSNGELTTVNIHDIQQGVAEGADNSVEALIQVYNNRDQKIIKTKVFASEEEANRWADRNNAVILKLKDVPKKSTLDETSAGSVATVVNPTPKNRAKIGTLFGGTYKQSKVKK